MNRKKELQAKLKANVAEMDAILAKGDVLSDEDESRWQELEAECSEIQTELDSIRDAEKVSAERKSRLDSLSQSVGQPTPRVTAPQQPGVNITRQRLASEDDPNAGFRNHREFHLAVMQAGTGRMDERLLPLKAAAGSDEHATFNDVYGGFLIPEGFMPGLKTTMAPSDPTAGRVTTVPMSNQVVHINARTDKNHSSSVSGGLAVYRREEAGTVSSSRMSVEQVKLEATMLMGVSYASEEILERSPISFAALLSQGFNDEFGNKIISEKLRGTGVGQLEGILNTPCLVTVSKETGQSADTIVRLNLVKMYARCWRPQSAIWLYNQTCLPTLMNLADNFGRFDWQPSTREGEPSTLLGIPAYATEYCSAVGDVGDIILCNWSEYLYGVLEGQRSAESMHVRFLEHERAFKYYMANAGKCWWRSAITPVKGADTLSPFVTLQAR